MTACTPFLANSDPAIDIDTLKQIREIADSPVKLVANACTFQGAPTNLQAVEQISDGMRIAMNSETQLSLPRSATVSPQAFPDVTLQVEELLG